MRCRRFMDGIGFGVACTVCPLCSLSVNSQLHMQHYANYAQPAYLTHLYSGFIQTM